MTAALVKIVFELEIDEDGYPPISSETLNARAAEQGFVVENTPFFAVGVSLGDRVAANPLSDGSGRYAFDRVLEASPNKAISIIFLDPDLKDAVYQELKGRGCYCEYGELGRDQQLQMLAVSVPEACDYASVAKWLAMHEAAGRLSYAELAV